MILLLEASSAQGVIHRVPRGYPTIQAALAAASAGDTVIIAPGTYFESLTMKPGVHIHGEPGAVLDGARTFGALVTAHSGVEATAILSGFVIRRSRQAGILLNQANPILRNNIITENTGPGIECAQASPQVTNNIITANSGGGIVCEYPGTAPVIAYNDFWHNQPEDLTGCTPGVGNREQAPGFVDAPQGNYHLRADSPLIDAGDPRVALDDTDGSRSDIGIYGGPVPTPEPRLRTAAPTPGSLFATAQPMRNSLSTQGLPGIIDIPTATMVPSGSLDLNYNTKLDAEVFGLRGADAQRNFNFAIGLLPRLTLGGRGTVATDTATDTDVSRDISANVQFLLLQEGLWWPAIAVGFTDISGGANLLQSRYVVLSKTAFGRVRGTVGFGIGPDLLDGPFAGVEIAVNRFVTLLGEYDTEDINVGVRLFPLPEKWEAYGIPRPVVDLIWQDGDDFSWGLTLRSALGEPKFRAQRAARAAQRYRRQRGENAAGATMSLQNVSEQLQTALIARGLENVRVGMLRVGQGYMAVVEYENRRYNRDELDGLGLVLGLTAILTPPSVTHMSVIVKEVNLRVLQVSTAVDDFLAFLNDEMSAEAFSQHFLLTQRPKWPPQAEMTAVTAPRQRSWLKVDVILRPAIETFILTEVGVADLRFSLLPDAFVQLTPGTVVNVRGNIPVTKTPDFPGQLGNPAIDRVLLHQALRLPLGSWSQYVAGLTQFSIGRFNEEEMGIANETALTFLDGTLFFKSFVARVGSAFDALDRWVALGTGRVRYAPWDMSLRVTAGLFRDQDRGVAVDLSRFFGNTEIGVFLRRSTNGSLGGIRLAVPLTPAKELKPLRLRPRLPDVYAYEQRTTVFTDRNVIRNDIGRALGTGHEIARVYWNRDRLYPAYIRQHLDTLKQAVRRWIHATTKHTTKERTHHAERKS